MLSYTTESLLKLRAAASSAEPIADHVSAALAERLQGLRKRALDLVTNTAIPRPVQQREFHGLFAEAWDALATLDEFVNPFALPPRCETATLMRATAWAANALLALELQRRPVGNQVILNGQKGSGKTTLLQAVGAVSAVLLETTIPIYWSYGEVAPNPSAADLFSGIPTVGMLLDAAASLVLGTALDMATALQSIPLRRRAVEAHRAFAAMKKAPLLLVDEFTSLYFADTTAPTPAAIALRAHGAAVMTDLHTLCKRCPNVVALLAASSSQVQRHIHPETSRRFIAYPTINNSIFVRHEVPLMRTAGEVMAYARKRYPGMALPSGEVLLDATGGVGRLIGSFISDPTMIPDVGVPQVLASPPLFALFCRILSVVDAGTMELPPDSPWAVLGIPRTDAANVLTARGMDDDAISDFVDEWCDSMLFTLQEGRLEVLRPATLRAFHFTLRGREVLQLARVLSDTVHGFEGGSAGHSTEDLIARYIHLLLGVRSATDGALVLAGEGVQWKASRAAPAVAHVGGLDTLLNRVMRWEVAGRETGIDRMWMADRGVHDPTGRRTVQVNLLQIQSANMSLSLTAGKLAKQRGQPTARVDDRTIAGVLVKAERGLQVLVPALARSFPGVMFELGQFALYSTKAVDGAAEIFREENPEHAEAFQLRVDPEGAAIRACGALHEAAAAAFEWRAVGGTDWLRDILPAPVIAAVL